MPVSDSFLRRPSNRRKTSHVPGGFEETDDELSPVKSDFPPSAHEDNNDRPSSETHTVIDGDGFNNNNNNTIASDRPPPPSGNDDDDSGGTFAEDSQNAGDRTVELDEGEMRRQLMDIESSFLPEVSRLGPGNTGAAPGADDTYVFGVVPKESSEEGSAVAGEKDRLEDAGANGAAAGESRSVPPSPLTPPESYKTPAPDFQNERLFQDRMRNGGGELESPAYGDTNNTSSLETMSSSPTAAAAARTVSRVVSMATIGGYETGYETADDRSPERSPTRRYASDPEDADSTPRRRRTVAEGPGSRGGSPTRGGMDGTQEDEEDSLEGQQSTGGYPRKRPKFLTSRQSAQRLSYSSHHSTNTDSASDATLGADFALQSGGAMPANSSSRNRLNVGGLSRSTSLGSLASGISDWSDNEDKLRNASGTTLEHNLSTLSEEDTAQFPPATTQKQGKDDSQGNPLTPKASNQDLAVPSDTVLAAHVRDVEVPGTFARQFREKHRPFSPDKLRPSGAMPTPSVGRSGKTMTLKEQSSTIDRLSKENFDLKMRIHFLNEALNKRSEEGIKEMISENVELKSDKLRLSKDNQSLRRTVRDLEKQLKEHESGEKDDEAKDQGSDDGKNPIDEEEFYYMKERIETYEVEIEKLRSESIAREGEKRRLAEMVKTLGDSRNGGSEVGAREERDMWKDMLEAETAAREQADDDNKKLREEIMRLKSDALSTNSQRSGKRMKRDRIPSVASRSTESDRGVDRNGVASSSSSTLVELELLRHENAELRREVGAQTSMLTSRNKEKERLYQEIEDLKLNARRDGRSVAGDSIFERSASRAHQRSASRTSDGTRVSHLSDAERDSFEVKNGELRDQVSALKLENQNLRQQLDEVSADLEATDRAYQADVEAATQDIAALELERDNAVKEADERESEFQSLKTEAQEEIDALGDERDELADEVQRLENDLRNTDENLKALQSEMRSMSEGLIRLEEDAQSNLEKYKAVQQELEESNRELEGLEKALFEANSKVQRLTVQQESSRNEIAFLREEQDGDKIKIGDLESALKTSQMSLQSEKEKTKDLDRRLAEERHQREVVGSREKQEVQRIMNDLNRELTNTKEEARKLKKSLSSREIEATTWKERLTDLETGLREALGDLDGTRSSLLTAVVRLQRELDATTTELESVRTSLDQKEQALKTRDSLLESHGLESRKLQELLDKERAGRRADKHSFEQSLKSHQQANRTISQNNSRIAELETARAQDRKKLSNLEQQYKDQLAERNSLLLSIWKRISTMCGPDWAHSNSLINGNLPSQEVIGNILFWPGFSRNLLLAVKTVEGLIGGFKTRIKTVERDLWKEYQSLEHTLDLRVKKLDRLEEAAQSIRAAQNPTPELTKLRGENRLLKAELNLMHKQELSSRHANSGDSSGGGGSVSRSGSGRTTLSAATAAATLMRHHSSSTVESHSHHHTGIPHPSNSIHPPAYTSSAATGPSRSNSIGRNPPPVASNISAGMTVESGQEKWIHRLRELERRLKAEREARLLDRSGARKRLEEEGLKNEELRRELEREKLRGVGMVVREDVGGIGRGPPRPSSSVTVDHEMIQAGLTGDAAAGEISKDHHPPPPAAAASSTSVTEEGVVVEPKQGVPGDDGKDGVEA